MNRDLNDSFVSGGSLVCAISNEWGCVLSAGADNASGRLLIELASDRLALPPPLPSSQLGAVANFAVRVERGDCTQRLARRISQMSTFEGRPQWDTSQDLIPVTNARDRFFEGAAAGATALIVEDDYRNCFALTALLNRGKMIVVTADSGPRALHLLERAGGVGIVLMDIMMPVMDGYETMRAIREQRQSAEVPIIAITGSGERDRCIAAGASDYIPKPVDTTALLTAVSYWLMETTDHLPLS
jgi:CheY-like chemotaxis protein